MNTLTSDIFIVDGNITIFLGSHSEAFKTDILHSSLFAQLVANDATTEPPTPDTWFTSYRKTLSRLYWSLISSKDLESKNKTYSIYNLAESGLSGILNEKQFAQLANEFSAITALPEDAQVIKAILQKIQNSNISPVNSNNKIPHRKETFTIATLLTVVLENKTLASLHLSFETTDPVDINILDQAIPQKQLIDGPASTTWCAYLVEGSYATISSDVTKKISNDIKSKILHVTPAILEKPDDFSSSTTA